MHARSSCQCSWLAHISNTLTVARKPLRIGDKHANSHTWCERIWLARLACFALFIPTKSGSFVCNVHSLLSESIHPHVDRWSARAWRLQTQVCGHTCCRSHLKTFPYLYSYLKIATSTSKNASRRTKPIKKKTNVWVHWLAAIKRKETWKRKKESHLGFRLFLFSCIRNEVIWKSKTT